MFYADVGQRQFLSSMFDAIFLFPSNSGTRYIGLHKSQGSVRLSSRSGITNKILPSMYYKNHQKPVRNSSVSV